MLTKTSKTFQYIGHQLRLLTSSFTEKFFIQTRDFYFLFSSLNDAVIRKTKILGPVILLFQISILLFVEDQEGGQQIQVRCWGPESNGRSLACHYLE